MKAMEALKVATGAMAATAPGDDRTYILYIYIYFSLAVKVKAATGDMTATTQGDDQPRREGVLAVQGPFGPRSSPCSGGPLYPCPGPRFDSRSLHSPALLEQ